MKYRTIIYSLILGFICGLTGFAQQEASVLTAPDGWRSEIIPFPLSFAPEIEFEGIEEIQFAPGWSDSESDEFWAYSFVWYIEKQSPMTAQVLTESFNYYYDGLMTAVAENQKESDSPVQFDQTLCLFIKTNEGFTGKMRVFDAFFKKDYIILNILVTESFCPQKNKQMVLFHISPKSFDNDVWQIFKAVELKVNCQ